MAAKTTQASGDWNTSGTWTGGVKPGSGDTATINHAVTVSTTEIVGVSPAAGAGTPALQLNADLTITGNLTCRGDVAMNTGGLIGSGTGIFEFDAHLAGTPSTARYIIRSTNFNAGNGKVSIVGTSSGSRFTLRSNAGGANGRIAYLEAGAITLENCDLQSIGDASNLAFVGACTDGLTHRFTNITLDSNCGGFGDGFGVASTPESILEYINVTSRSTQDVGIANEAPTTGTRTMSGCRFTGAVKFYQCTGFNVSDTVFEGSYDVTGGPWTSWTNNLDAMAPADSGGHVAAGPYSDSVVLRIGDPSNQHGVSSDDNGSTFDGIIFDMPDGTDGAGDCIVFNNPSSPKSFAVTRCIVLKNSIGEAVGTMISLLGGANITVSVEHCTYFAGFGVYVGETYAGHAGMLSSVKSNIAMGVAGTTPTKIRNDSGGSGTNNIVSAANADYNCGFGLDAGVELKGYDTPMTGTPGAHDVDQDPSFVNSSRNIKTWDTSLGGAGTVANALTELRKKNDSAGYNTAYTITAYRTYVQGGFIPQNTNIRTAAHDGTVIGAVQTALTGSSWLMPPA